MPFSNSILPTVLDTRFCQGYIKQLLSLFKYFCIEKLECKYVYSRFFSLYKIILHVVPWKWLSETRYSLISLSSISFPYYVFTPVMFLWHEIMYVSRGLHETNSRNFKIRSFNSVVWRSNESDLRSLLCWNTEIISNCSWSAWTKAHHRPGKEKGSQEQQDSARDEYPTEFVGSSKSDKNDIFPDSMILGCEFLRVTKEVTS